MTFVHHGHDHHTKFKACDTSLDFIDDGSMSNTEKLCFIIGELKTLTEKVDVFEGDLDAKEDSVNITTNRLLSLLGDFTGSLDGESVSSVIVRINDNESTIDDVAKKINDKTALQFIIDGGIFPFTEPANIEVDGGVVI